MSKAPDRAIATVFAALGDETRVAIVRRLTEDGCATATALADGAHMTRQAIVKHLTVLHDAGLVTRARSGREVLYAVDATRVVFAHAFLDGVSRRWDRALLRLRALVEDDGAEGERDAKGSGR